MGSTDAVDVRALARGIASGDVTATDVVGDWLERLRRVNEVTNCVAAWNTEGALAQAAELDRAREQGGPVGPLHGVPFTVKDWIDAAGIACTGGFVECRERVPRADATVVARMRAAGAVLLAKTTVQVETELFGTVLNPRDAARSPGGSSSGEAAAVAGGGSPVGLASDSGGSIRLPAAWCGAPALKPTFGRVPTTGHFPRVGERSDGRTQIGPIGATVRDVIDVLAIIAGPDNRDTGAPPVALGDAGLVRLAGVRVGWSLGDASWKPSPAIRTAVEWSVAQLAVRGVLDVGEIPQHLDEALDVTRRYWTRARGVLPADDAERHLVDWDRYRVRMLTATDGVDVVLMPAAAEVAPIHRPIEETDYIFTLSASLTGWPAAVVPVAGVPGAGGGDLPVAVQIVARPWRDDLALAVAAALEGAAGLAGTPTG